MRACVPACMRAAVVVWLRCACAVAAVLLCLGGAVLVPWFWCPSGVAALCLCSGAHSKGFQGAVERQTRGIDSPQKLGRHG
eukprot:102769-Alexandrium_andersonii.AAC.1